MRAAVAHAWGGPGVLRVEDVPDPVAGAGEVSVLLRASSVNFHDILVRETGRGFPLPSILGIDGAGVREDTGEEVVIYPALNWGDDPDFFGADFAIVGDATDGTYAERIVVPESSVFPKPARLSWEEAGALPIAGLTAYRALFTHGRVAPGEIVLVLGAGSGVSMLAVALATAAGARVFVTSSSQEKIDRAVAAGASGGFLYTDINWPDQVVASTGGAHVVIDGAGGSLQESINAARRGGRIVVFGTSGGSEASLNIPSLFFGQKSVIGTTSGSPGEFARMLEMVATHDIKPVIDRVFDLSEIVAAHEYMEARSHVGKIAIRIS